MRARVCELRGANPHDKGGEGAFLVPLCHLLQNADVGIPAACASVCELDLPLLMIEEEKGRSSYFSALFFRVLMMI